MTIATGGFFFAVHISIQKFLYSGIPAGYSPSMATLLILGGMIMFMLGVIGEYVGRIYMNVNRITQYVVREMVNID